LEDNKNIRRGYLFLAFFGIPVGIGFIFRGLSNSHIELSCIGIFFILVGIIGYIKRHKTSPK